MALWGKGMILLRDKQDYRAHGRYWRSLAQLLPAGAERSQVEKAIREMPAPVGKSHGRSQLASCAVSEPADRREDLYRSKT